MSYFDAVRMSSTSLACKSEPYASSTSLAPKSKPEVELCHILMSFACPPPPSHATARRRWIFVTLSEPLTSQGRTAVSVDTRTALARSLGQFWSHTRVRVLTGWGKGFKKPGGTQTRARVWLQN